MKELTFSDRRTTLKSILAAVAAPSMSGRPSAAHLLAPTPFLTAGPFYPRDPSGLPFLSASATLPQPLTNDLTCKRPGGRAEGRHILISGRVMDVAGRPLVGAVVEIWSVNARNIYLVEDGGASDPDFAGFGMTATDGDGRYSFKTIRPGGYDRYLGLIRRTAHIHVLVKVAGAEAFTTELWFADEPRNSIDSFFSRITDPGLKARMAVLLNRSDGVDRAQFDLVLSPRYAGRVRS